MRYLVIFAALIMQLCLGATYSWSVYVQDIRTLLGLSQAQAQIPFSARPVRSPPSAHTRDAWWSSGLRDPERR